MSYAQAIQIISNNCFWQYFYLANKYNLYLHCCIMYQILSCGSTDPGGGGLIGIAPLPPLLLLFEIMKQGKNIGTEEKNERNSYITNRIIWFLCIGKFITWINMQYLKKQSPQLLFFLVFPDPFWKFLNPRLYMHLIHKKSKCVDHVFIFEWSVSNVFPFRSTLNQGE